MSGPLSVGTNQSDSLCQVIFVASIQPKERPLSIRQRRLAEFSSLRARRKRKDTCRREKMSKRKTNVITPCAVDSPNLTCPITRREAEMVRSDEVKIIFSPRDILYSDSEVAVLSDLQPSRKSTESVVSAEDVPPRPCGRVGLIGSHGVGEVGDRYHNKPPEGYVPSDDLVSMSEERKEVPRPYRQVWHSLWEHQDRSVGSRKSAKTRKEGPVIEQVTASANNVVRSAANTRKARKGVFHPEPMVQTRVARKNIRRPARPCRKKSPVVDDNDSENTTGKVSRMRHCHQLSRNRRPSLPKVVVTTASRPMTALSNDKILPSSNTGPGPVNPVAPTERFANRVSRINKVIKITDRPRFSVPIKASRVPMECSFEQMMSQGKNSLKRESDLSGFKYRKPGICEPFSYLKNIPTHFTFPDKNRPLRISRHPLLSGHYNGANEIEGYPSLNDEAFTAGKLRHDYGTSGRMSSGTWPLGFMYGCPTRESLMHHYPSIGTDGSLIYPYDLSSPDYFLDAQTPTAYRFSHPNAPDVLISPPPSSARRADILRAPAPAGTGTETPPAVYDIPIANFAPRFYGGARPDSIKDSSIQARVYMPSVDLSQFEPPARPPETLSAQDKLERAHEERPYVKRGPSSAFTKLPPTEKARKPTKTVMTFSAQVPSIDRVATNPNICGPTISPVQTVDSALLSPPNSAHDTSPKMSKLSSGSPPMAMAISKNARKGKETDVNSARAEKDSNQCKPLITTTAPIDFAGDRAKCPESSRADTTGVTERNADALFVPEGAPTPTQRSCAQEEGPGGSADHVDEIQPDTESYCGQLKGKNEEQNLGRSDAGKSRSLYKGQFPGGRLSPVKERSTEVQQQEPCCGDFDLLETGESLQPSAIEKKESLNDGRVTLRVEETPKTEDDSEKSEGLRLGYFRRISDARTSCTDSMTSGPLPNRKMSVTESSTTCLGLDTTLEDNRVTALLRSDANHGFQSLVQHVDTFRPISLQCKLSVDSGNDKTSRSTGTATEIASVQHKDACTQAAVIVETEKPRLTVRLMSTVVDVPPVVKKTLTIGTNTDETNEGDKQKKESVWDFLVYNEPCLDNAGDRSLSVESSALDEFSRLKPFFKSRSTELATTYKVAAAHSVTLDSYWPLSKEPNTSLEKEKNKYCLSFDDDLQPSTHTHSQATRVPVPVPVMKHCHDRRVSFRQIIKSASLTEKDTQCQGNKSDTGSIDSLAAMCTKRTERVSKSKPCKITIPPNDAFTIVPTSAGTLQKVSSSSSKNTFFLESCNFNRSVEYQEKKFQEVSKQTMSSNEDFDFDSVIALKRKPGCAVCKKIHQSKMKGILKSNSVGGQYCRDEFMHFGVSKFTPLKVEGREEMKTCQDHHYCKHDDLQSLVSMTATETRQNLPKDDCKGHMSKHFTIIPEFNLRKKLELSKDESLSSVVTDCSSASKSTVPTICLTRADSDSKDLSAYSPYADDSWQPNSTVKELFANQSVEAEPRHAQLFCSKHQDSKHSRFLSGMVDSNSPSKLDNDGPKYFKVTGVGDCSEELTTSAEDKLDSSLSSPVGGPLTETSHCIYTAMRRYMRSRQQLPLFSPARPDLDCARCNKNTGFRFADIPVPIKNKSCNPGDNCYSCKNSGEETEEISKRQKRFERCAAEMPRKYGPTTESLSKVVDKSERNFRTIVSQNDEPVRSNNKQSATARPTPLTAKQQTTNLKTISSGLLSVKYVVGVCCRDWQCSSPEHFDKTCRESSIREVETADAPADNIRKREKKITNIIESQGFGLSKRTQFAETCAELVKQTRLRPTIRSVYQEARGPRRIYEHTGTGLGHLGSCGYEHKKARQRVLCWKCHRMRPNSSSDNK